MNANLYNEFCSMVSRSWTFERMTESERSRCWDALSAANDRAVKGKDSTRLEILHAVYDAYLLGLGYDGFSWREEPEIVSVIVEVNGGMVQNVYSSAPVTVEVIDLDSDDADENALTAAQKNLSLVW